MILSAGRCFPCFVFIFPHYREKKLMVNTMESEVYEGDVYNNLTASIFELGNGSEFIFFGIWLGKPLEKHALMRFNGLERTTWTSVFNCNHGYGGSAIQKDMVVAMNWQFEEGYMKDMKVTTRPQTFGKMNYSLVRCLIFELITHLPHPFLCGKRCKPTKLPPVP